ncbi:uncharacterized protein LOC144926002 [Branchiostoma floridae x Branchiostoma belcheri]
MCHVFTNSHHHSEQDGENTAQVRDKHPQGDLYVTLQVSNRNDSWRFRTIRNVSHRISFESINCAVVNRRVCRPLNQPNCKTISICLGMVNMNSFRPTPKFIFLSILILSIGAAYMYISYNGVHLSIKEMESSALPFEKDDWDKLAEAEEEQSRRLATLKEYCKKNISTGDPRRVSVQGHLLFYDNIKTIYCYIPKAGCKTMKLLFYNLEYNKTERLISVGTADFEGKEADYIAPNAHKSGWIHGRGHKKMKHYSEEELSLRLATYRKIIVVRDPFERLASAWLNKFVNMPARGAATRICRKLTFMASLSII